MLPTTGAISFNDLKNEFGDVNPISLNEFYSGGALVPIATTGLWGAVPAAGKISMGNFKGSSGSLLTGAHWSSTTVIGSRIVGADNNLATGPNRKSSDYGFTWQTFAPSAPGAISYFLNGRFFLTDCATYSDDLLTWQSGPAVAAYEDTIDMCVGTLYSQQRMVRLFRSFSEGYSYGTGAQYSTNGGSTWSSKVYFNAGRSSYSGLNQIVFFAGASGGLSVGADGLFVHQPYQEDFVNTSPDAVTWTKRYIYSNGSVAPFLSVNTVIHNGLYISVSAYGQIMTSSDGINYSISSVLPNALATYASNIGLASCGSYVLAAYKLSDGTLGLATTTDGVSWTSRSNFDVAADYENDLLCVGSYWLLATSTQLWHAPV